MRIADDVHTEPLPSLSSSSALPLPLNATARMLDTEHGRVMLYEKGEGSPILFVHSFNAAGSAVELRPLFDRFAKTNRVIAFDWLGFGRSERPDIEYSPALYRSLLKTVLDEVSPDPVDVISLSLPSQYVVLQAVDDADGFRRIALISPTGFGRFGGAGSDRFLSVLRNTPVGGALFRLLRTGPSIDYFINKLFVDKKRIPAGYRRYNRLTTREPGSQYAPIYFVSGKLNDPHAPAAYERVAVPTLMVFGEQCAFADPMAGQRLADCNVMLKVVTFADAADLPQIELPDATYNVISHFLADEPKPEVKPRAIRSKKKS